MVSLLVKSFTWNQSIVLSLYCLTCNSYSNYDCFHPLSPYRSIVCQPFLRFQFSPTLNFFQVSNFIFMCKPWLHSLAKIFYVSRGTYAAILKMFFRLSVVNFIYKIFSSIIICKLFFSFHVERLYKFELSTTELLFWDFSSSYPHFLTRFFRIFHIAYQKIGII